jgi:hypothetical protein
MKWLKEWGWAIALILVFVMPLVLWLVSAVKPDQPPDSGSMIDITEYSVAGGGVQRVITFRGDGVTYEVVITEE